MADKWEKLSSEVIFEHPRIRLAEDRVRLPNGQETDYLIFDSLKDFPTIVAVDDEERVLVIEEHAYPYNGLLLQFPEGLTNGEEPIQDAAARELREETGLRAEKIEEIGSDLRNHRRSTNRQVVLLATGLSEVEKSGGEVEEGEIKLHWFAEAEVWQMIAEGKIIQQNALSAWSIYQAYKNRNS